MVASPHATTWPQRRRGASATWPSTRKPASGSRTWSKASGSIASCATSMPPSKPASHASSAPTAWRAAPGVASNTSKLTSGPRSWPTTSSSLPASNRAEAAPSFAMPRTGQSWSRRMRATRAVTPFWPAIGALSSVPAPTIASKPAQALVNAAFMDGNQLAEIAHFDFFLRELRCKRLLCSTV